MNDEQSPSGAPGEPDGPATSDADGLYDELVARSHGIRDDAERSLARATSLYARGDPRAVIALSACRDALSGYHEAVTSSLDQVADRSAPQSPQPPRERAVPPGRARRRIAQALAGAGAALLLALTAWASAPSLFALRAAPPTGAVGAGDATEIAAGAPARSSARGLRGVVAASLPAASPPTPIDGGPAARDQPSEGADGGAPAAPAPPEPERGEATAAPTAPAPAEPADPADSGGTAGDGGLPGPATVDAAVDALLDTLSGGAAPDAEADRPEPAPTGEGEDALELDTDLDLDGSD